MCSAPAVDGGGSGGGGGGGGGGGVGSSHDGLSFHKYMIAGSIAGIVEHTAMFPIDTLKTRMQMLGSATPSASGSPSPAQFRQVLTSIIRNEGPLGLYRGIAAICLGAGPAHAVYFSVYEVCKDKLGGNRAGGHHPIIHAASGIAATVASDAVLTPMDVVKQRLQLRFSPYCGLRDCVARMVKEEGVGAFYASYRTTVIMNAPFTAVHFSTYEAVKKVLSELSPVNASEETVVVHLTAGGAAGALASAVTTPLDVVKTRLQCQELAFCVSKNIVIKIWSTHSQMWSSSRIMSVKNILNHGEKSISGRWSILHTDSYTGCMWC